MPIDLLSVLSLSAAIADERAPVFAVSSPDMADGRIAQAQFANTIDGDGENLSPQIDWRGAPANTKSFVVTLFDRDAPTGFGWWHWIVANIPPTATSLARGAGTKPSTLPAGAVLVNTDLGVPGYGGPLPPRGETHRYVVTVTALDIPKLDLPPTMTPALLAYLMSGHTLGKASFTALGSQ